MESKIFLTTIDKKKQHENGSKSDNESTPEDNSSSMKGPEDTGWRGVWQAPIDVPYARTDVSISQKFLEDY